MEQYRLNQIITQHDYDCIAKYIKELPEYDEVIEPDPMEALLDRVHDIEIFYAQDDSECVRASKYAHIADKIYNEMEQQYKKEYGGH